MIFAILFFLSFVIGLVCYLASDRWWLGGVICTAIGVIGIAGGLLPPSMKGLAIYFGLPIIFLGSLFSAYIVQLRRAPDIEPMEDNSAAIAPSEGGDSTETDIKPTNDKAS